ncbi:MAG: hypothetical protein EBS36_06615 [Actinobacteria bacterium]|nr:hypothetical protein [Actinomycetota bacterium]NBY15093.1 hypothetical protein [Actinomycetota bacterium]
MAIPLRIGARSGSQSELRPNVNRKVRQDFRLWTGIGLLIFSILGISRLINLADQRIAVVALQNSVSAGTTLTISDLQLVRVAVPNSNLYLKDLNQAVGLTTSKFMEPGELLPAPKAVSGTKANVRVVSLPIRAGHLPAIEIGDQVDLWSTPSLDGLTLPGPPKLVAQAVTVSDIPVDSEPNSDTAISVQVEKSDLRSVLTALRDGVLDVVAIAD